MANNRYEGDKRPRRLSPREELDLRENLREIEQEEEEIRREYAARKKRRAKQREMERRRRRRQKKIMMLAGAALLILIVIIALVAVISGVVKRSRARRQAEAEALAAAASSSEEEIIDPATLASSVTLAAVGDNLISQRLIDQAASRANGSGYDFSYVYSEVSDYIRQHEVGWVDVETCINNEIAPAGYPTFSTPGANGAALYDAGFNVFSLANNHTYDLLAEGIAAELDFFENEMPADALITGLWKIEESSTSGSNATGNSGQSGADNGNTAENSVQSESGSDDAAAYASGDDNAESVESTGTEALRATSEDAENVTSDTGAAGGTAGSGTADADDLADEIPIFTTAEGKKIAFLTYSELSNIRNDGLESTDVPEGADHHIIFLYETDVIREQIRRADELADAVVVGCHWGTEDSHEITNAQRTYAQFIADCGADLIIGAHSHVVQNVEWIEAEDGRQVFCAYSLGNFVSTQESPDNLVGAILDCTLNFNSQVDVAAGAPEVTVTDPKLVPIVTAYGENAADAHVVLFSNYTDEQASAHGIYSVDSSADLTPAAIEQMLRDNLHDDYLALED